MTLFIILNNQFKFGVLWRVVRVPTLQGEMQEPTRWAIFLVS